MLQLYYLNVNLNGEIRQLKFEVCYFWFNYVYEQSSHQAAHQMTNILKLTNKNALHKSIERHIIFMN